MHERQEGSARSVCVTARAGRRAVLATIPALISMLVVVGALGSLTTFSMFSVEMLQFIEHGNWALALAYMLGSVIICVALVAFGLQLGKLF